MSWARRLALPALLMAAPVLFFHEICLADRVFLLRDLHNWFYPWRDLARRSFASGEIPLWNPWSYMGTPFLANMQSGLLYPINAFFWILEFPAAMRAFVVAQFGITALMMARMLRALGCRPVSCATGALAWAYGGWMLVHIEFPNKLSAAGWLPLIMMGLLTWWQGRPRRGLVLGAAGVALSLAAGYPQTTVTIVLGAGVLWGAWLIRLGAAPGRPGLFSAALSLPAMLAAGALAAAVQLVPFAQAAALSERAAPREAALVLQNSLHPGHLLDLLLPHIFGLPGYQRFWGGALLQSWLGHVYVGLPVIALAALALLALRRAGPSTGSPSRRWAAGAGLGLLVFSVLLCLGDRTPLGPILVAVVPGMAYFRWFSTTSLLIAFALCWLAPLGLEEILDRLQDCPRARARVAWGAGLLAAGAAALAAVAVASPSLFLSATRLAVSPVMLPEQAPALDAHIDLVRGDVVRAAVVLIALAVAAVAVARGRVTPARASLAVPVVIFLDLMGAASGVNFAGDPDLYRHEPATLARLRQTLVPGSRLYVTQDTLEADVQMYGEQQEGYFHWASEIFLFNLNLPYGLFSASDGDPVRPERTAAWQQEVETTTDSERRRRLVAAAGVSQVLRGRPGRPTEMIEVPGVMPRARVVPGLRRIPPELALEAVASGAWDPAREALVEDDAPPAMRPPGDPIPHTIHAVRHTMNTVTVEVSASSPGYLVLSDMMYPGWRAEVDGRPAPLFTADHMFRGLELPEGRHTVVYTYRPASVTMGALGSLAGLAVLVLVSRRWGSSRPAGGPGTAPVRPRTKRTP